MMPQLKERNVLHGPGNLHVSCVSPYVGNCSKLVQLLNKQPIIELKMNTSLIKLDGVTRSRASLIQLAAEDELHVRMPTLNSYYCDRRMVNVLTEFLVNLTSYFTSDLDGAEWKNNINKLQKNMFSNAYYNMLHVNWFNSLTNCTVRFIKVLFGMIVFL